MSSPLHAVLSGSFTSDGSIVNLSLPSGYNDFQMTNISDIGSAAANTNVMKARGTSLMLDGSGYYSPKTSGAATIALEATTLTGGFTFVSNSADIVIGASTALNGTPVNQASPAVANTGTTTGLVAGSSVVRMFSTTGMLQISSMDFTVGTIVGSTSFELKYLISSGFAAAASAGSFRIINATSAFYPRRRFITAISAAASAVITLSVVHQFTVGQAIRVVVPSVFGMTQINGLVGNITAISTANNTITVDINSSGFTAFAFPTSAIAGAGITFAQVSLLERLLLIACLSLTVICLMMQPITNLFQVFPLELPFKRAAFSISGLL